MALTIGVGVDVGVGVGVSAQQTSSAQRLVAEHVPQVVVVPEAQSVDGLLSSVQKIEQKESGHAGSVADTQTYVPQNSLSPAPHWQQQSTTGRPARTACGTTAASATRTARTSRPPPRTTIS